MNEWDWNQWAVGGAAARDDSFTGLNPVFNQQLQAMFRAAPEEIRSQLRVLSAFRSPETQRRLWENALEKYGDPSVARKWVAPPGNSHHNHGTAVDLRYLDPAAQEWVHANAANFGLHFPMEWEPWHIEPIGPDGGRLGLGAEYHWEGDGHNHGGSAPSRSFPEGVLAALGQGQGDPAPALAVASLSSSGVPQQQSPEASMRPLMSPTGGPPVATSVRTPQFTTLGEFSTTGVNPRAAQRRSGRSPMGSYGTDLGVLSQFVVENSGPPDYSSVPLGEDQITTIAERAIEQAEQQGMEPEEIAGAMGIPAPQRRPPRSTPNGGQDQPQGEGQEGERRGFLEWLMPDLDEDQRRQALLSIGAGLLSGEDFQEGLALAGQNLLGMRQGQLEDEREDELRKEDMAFDMMMQDRRLAASQAARASNVRFQPVGSVRDGDGNIVDGVSYDPTTAQYFTYRDGERVVIEGARPLNRSSAAGDRLVTASQIGEIRSSLTEASGTLRAIDRVMEQLDTATYGIPGFIDDMQGNIRTLSGRLGLTPEQLARRVANGEIQGLIGSARTEVVGPGVMTEQDALRVLAALGGDLSSITTNPDVMRERLGILWENTNRRYQRELEQYNAFRDVVGADSWIEISPYEGGEWRDKGALDSSNAGVSEDVESILSEYGL